jgi:hypothetical protein
LKYPDSHIIQRQEIEINFTNPDDAMGLQNRIAEVFYDKIQPEIEKLLDEKFDKNHFASIDKLDIDIGSISENNWEQELLENTLRQLKTELSVTDKLEIKQDDSQSENAFNFFMYFLENGFLPWNNRFDSVKELESSLVINSTRITKLKALMRNSDKAVTRLTYQFSDHFRFGIIDAFASSRGYILRNLFSIRESLEEIQIDARLIDAGVIKALSNNLNEKVVLNFFGYLNRSILVEEEAKSVLREIIKSMDAVMKDVVKENLIDGSAPEKTETDEIIIKPGSQSVYLINAGIIILHPFLTELFTQIGLIEDQKWVNVLKQQKAAAVLEYLATGDNVFFEFDLPLNKILCGIELDDVIIPQKELSAKIKSECENLLNQVIQHWSVLKNTSAEALRETFFMRNGKLSKVDNGWLLQVEHKSLDLLLSHLPWGIGLIKLPWMKEMLHVEWT